MTRSLEIAVACDEIKNLLTSKNMSYGDSALNPVRIFSKSDNLEQILVRIDDKLSRIQRGAGLIASDEDVINDLIGYLVLLKIALKSKVQPQSLVFAGGSYMPDGNPDKIVLTSGMNTKGNRDVWDGTDIDMAPHFCLRGTQSNHLS